MLTIFICSSSKNFKATDTFSNFWDLKVGLLLCFDSFFPERTSISVMSLNPSDRSVSRFPMFLFTVFKCSLAHLVNVFCWILFHCASSARSRSAADISSSISAPSSVCSRGSGPTEVPLLPASDMSQQRTWRQLSQPQVTPDTAVISTQSSSFLLLA